MKKFKISTLAMAMAVITATPSIALANDSSATSVSKVAAQNRDNQVEFTSKKIDSVKSALMAYYTTNLAWPANLSDITAGATPYYSGTLSTPFGTIAGNSSTNSYELTITDTITQSDARKVQFRILAGRQAGTYNEGSRRVGVSVAIPHSASIVGSMLSRLPDASGSGLNTMQVDLDMGNFDISSINALQATSVQAGTVQADTITTTSGSNLDTVSTMASNNATSITTLQGQMTTVQTSTADNATNITGLTARADAADITMAANADNITLLQTTTTANSAGILTNTESITTLNSDLALVQSSVTTNSSEILGLASRTTDLEDELHALTKTGGELYAMNVKINQTMTDIDVLNSITASNISRLNSVEADVSDLQSDVESVEERVENLENAESGVAYGLWTLTVSGSRSNPGGSAISTVPAMFTSTPCSPIGKKGVYTYYQGSSSSASAKRYSGYECLSN